MENRIPRPGELYRHFKNKLYQVIAVAEHTETGEAMVVYQALYGDFNVYVRPLEMFLSRVDLDKYPGVLQEYRFEPVDRESLSGNAPRKEGEEADSRLETWKESRQVISDEASGGWDGIEEELSDLEDYGESEADRINPHFLDFLEARTYESKVLILESMKDELDDEMIDGLAMAIDVEIPAGPLERRYHELHQCLETMAHYESTRLR